MGGRCVGEKVVVCGWVGGRITKGRGLPDGGRGRERGGGGWGGNHHNHHDHSTFTDSWY